MMKEAVAAPVATAAMLKRKMDGRFRRNGIAYGLISGITFGLYSTVVAVAMMKDPFLGVVGAFAAPLVASAINDTLAAIWLVIWNIMKGRTKEIGRSLVTIPGLMVALAALFGGPIANGAYLVGIDMAGAAAIPISALCPMFGAIFARMFLKQKIDKRVAIGMLICVVGAALISYVKPEGGTENFTLGIVFALVAAVGWGLEGVFSAFGMSMIDSNIAITIREGVSGIVYIAVVLPLFSATDLFASVLGSVSPMLIIAIAALFTAISFLTWYMANNMVGVAVGMSLNITYVLWGVVFAAIFLGDTLTPTVIAGAIIITIGALLVSMNPMDLFKKEA
ncbi:DMT family transporter [Paenibacillus faecalis]|uniref:DMT family transporter n=1 Tax=Paenibacillus faecalis TaxID=2079532 RepID=UPI001F2D26C5|nr:DMT family transporter [Paenibacillus faecalis]